MLAHVCVCVWGDAVAMYVAPRTDEGILEDNQVRATFKEEKKRTQKARHSVTQRKHRLRPDTEKDTLDKGLADDIRVAMSREQWARKEIGFL